MLLLAAALALAACMPKVDSGDRARRVIIAKAYIPPNLDPGSAATGNEHPILQLAYETLFELDPASPTGAARGQLAQDWRLSDDGLRLDIALKPGRRFADGSPVDAAAVKYSFDRVKRIGRSAAVFLEWLDRTEVVAPDRVRLHLKRPYAPATQLLAQSAAAIVNPKVVGAHDVGDDGAAWLALNSAGSGPYAISAFRPSESVVLRANPLAARRPTGFSEVEFRLAPDEGVRRLLLERGDVDLTDIVPAGLAARYAALPEVNVMTIPGGSSLSFLTLNTRRGPFADRRVRQAAASAIDYQGLRTQVLKGNAIQLAGYLPPSAQARPEPPPSRDLAQARRLLAEAGYAGEPLVFLVGQVGPVAEFIQSNLRDAGFNVRIERRSPGAMMAQKQSGDFDLTYDGWSLDTPHPGPMLEALFASRGIETGANGSGYSNPDVDRLIDAVLAEPDPARAAASLRAIDAQLRADRPVVMIFSANPILAYRSDLRGVTINPFKPSLIDFAALRRASAP